jgi:hypothetical protein
VHKTDTFCWGFIHCFSNTLAMGLGSAYISTADLFFENGGDMVSTGVYEALAA